MRISAVALATAIAGLAALPVLTGGYAGYGWGTSGAIAVILALGYQVAYGLTGQLSFAHAPLMGVGAYATALLTTATSWSWWAAAPAAVLVAAAVGALVGLPTIRVRGDVLALTTLGAGEILQALYLRLGLTGGYQGVLGVPRVRVGGWSFTGADTYGLALVLVAVTAAAVIGLRHSPIGRAMLAARDDEHAAASLGIPAARLRMIAFVITAGIAGLAGSLYAAQDGYVSSVSFGLTQTMTTVIIVLLAGQARVGRTVIAAAVFTVAVQNLAGVGQISDAMTGALVLGVLALRLPIVGRALRGWAVPLRARAMALRLWAIAPRQRMSGVTGSPVGRARHRDAAETVGGSRTGQPVIGDDSMRRRPGGTASTEAVACRRAPGMLALWQVSRAFAGVHAVRELNLRVDPGRVIGLIGPNGSGKTTAVNLATGTQRPDAGNITVDAADLTGAGPRRFAAAGVIRTFQGLRLFDGLTVGDNVLVGAQRGTRLALRDAWLRTPAARAAELTRRARAGQALADVGAAALADRPVRLLSHGQRRRVELARAIAARPRYLILDEPTAGLEPSAAADLVRVLDRLRSAGVGILLVEHDLDMVASLCDDTVHLDAGVPAR